MRSEKFEWDENKNQINIKKHGISFEEAEAVFDDDNAIYLDDEEHSQEEARFVVIGRNEKQKTLVVCHCYRDSGTIIRLISARKADKLETDWYYGGMQIL